MTRLAVVRPAFATAKASISPLLPVRAPATVSPLGAWMRRLFAPTALALALGIGALAALWPHRTLAACLVVGLAALIWLRPALAAYILIVVTPLTAGIDRGLAIPLLRPSEAVAVFVGGTLMARGVFRWRTGRLPRLHLSPVEVSLVLMAVCSSVVPIIWMVARQHPIEHDDVLYAIVMWKFLFLYAIVRLSVTRDDQIRRCLWLSVGAASIVAVIAILQSLQLFGVPGLLAHYYSPYGHTGALEHARGSSTLALPAATGDLLIYNLAIVTGLWMQRRRFTGRLAILALLFVAGALASGEFSTAIGLAIAIVCIVFVTSSPDLLAFFVVAGAAALAALRSVIERRLSGFQSASGLPASWIGRLNNLETYFWPPLFSDWNFLFGVRPAARVVVPYQATGYVWIESGYTWLLWGGGIPLVGSFVYFVYTTVRMSWRVARQRGSAASIAGMSAFVAVVVTTVLMIFDPHLTYRGSGDELFFLLALTAVGSSRLSPTTKDSQAGVAAVTGDNPTANERPARESD